MQRLTIVVLTLTLCPQTVSAEEYADSWVRDSVTYKASADENAAQIRKVLTQRIQKKLPTMFSAELVHWKAATKDAFVLRLSTIPIKEPEAVRGQGGGYSKAEGITPGATVRFRVSSPQVLPQPAGSLLIEVDVKTTVLWEQRLAGHFTTNLMRDRILATCQAEVDRIGREFGVQYELVEWPQPRKEQLLPKLGK